MHEHDVSVKPGGRRRDGEPRDAAREVLFSRVVDGLASASDWDAFAEVAAKDPSVFRTIGSMQADRDALEAAVEDAIASADRIDPDGETEHHRVFGFAPFAVRAWRGWGGWAAAAALVLVWITGLYGSTWSNPGSPPSSRTGSHSTGGRAVETAGLGASLAGALDPSEMLERYLSEGRDAGTVVEAPEPVVLDAQPSADGSAVEVVYLRQIVERRRVEQVQRFQVNEHGELLPDVVPAREVTRRRAAF